MSEPYIVRPESKADFAGIYTVYGLTLRESEARLVERLREEKTFEPGLSLVAVADGIVLGHILFSRLKMAGRTGNKIKGAGLAPMAVLPQCQRLGIGTALVSQGLEAAAGLGYEAVIVMGHEEYYPRFGFSAELGKKIQCPYSGKHLMALELRPGALAGEKKVSALYPKPFSMLE